MPRMVLTLLVIGCVTIGSAPSTYAQAEQDADQQASSPAVPSQLRSARATMTSFLRETNAGNFAMAARCLDLSELDPQPTGDDLTRYVRNLKGVIDRLAWVNLEKISDDPNGDDYGFPPDKDDAPIVIARGDDGGWRFTAATVQQIPELFEQYKDQPLVVAETPWYRQMTFIGSEMWRIASLFAAILLGYVAGKILRFSLSKSANSLERRDRVVTAIMLRALAKAAVFFLLVVGLKVGLQFLLLAHAIEQVRDTVLSVLMALAVAYVAYCLIDVVEQWLLRLAGRTQSKLDDMLVPMVRASLRVTIVVLVLVQIITILSDKPVTSVIAGLGVGGLAIGLAAQDTIKNFFGSIMIFSDRPFEMGDRVVVDGEDGTVETVGFRSTRVRTLDGHVVTIPNGELANQTIRNIAKRPFLRRSMNLGVTYDTPPDKMQQAIDILEELLKDHEGMDSERPPRIFFTEFDASALNIAVMYWYHPADYWEFMRFSHELNFEVLRRFNDEGIEFAFPSQTLYLAGDPNRPLTPILSPPS